MPSTKPVNVIFCGPAQSGKTKLFKQFSGQNTSELVSLFPSCEFDFNHQWVKAWDGIPSEDCSNLTNAIFLYCIDLSKEIDEAALIQTIDEIRKHKPFHVMLVGTKNDMPGANERFEKLQEYDEKFGLNAVSTSSSEVSPEDQSLRNALALPVFKVAENRVTDRANLDRVPTPASNNTSEEDIQDEEIVDPRNESEAKPNEATAKPPVTPSEESSPKAIQLRPFDEAAQSLEISLKQFHDKSKKIMKEVGKLKQIILDASKSNQDKQVALQAFHNKSLAILEHKRHPAVKALLAFTAFVFTAVVVAAIGFSIMGLVTGVWAPALFIAALVATQPAAIAVVSTAGAAALTAGACATYGLFKAPKPIGDQKDAINKFVTDEQAKLTAEV